MRFICVLAATTIACGDNHQPPIDTGPQPIEVAMSVTVPPATEVEFCQFVTIPDAWVTHDAVEFTAGSHHVLLYQTSYATIPTRNDDGVAVDTSQPFDCTAGATNGWKITKLIAGSQNHEGESVLDFPPGVAIHVGGIALLNVHYINSSETALATDVTVTLSTVEQHEVEQQGDILFLYNPMIAVPAHQTARAHWRCPVYRDITIANAQSHMHARGVDYSARVSDGAPFYTSTQWENVPVRHYDNLHVPAGATLEYHCDYRNLTDHDIFQGPRTTDEMCMLIGSYYPADPLTANCLDPTGSVPGGDWIGQGTATCQATLGCLQTANGFPAVTTCVLAAAPAVAHEVSELVRCVMTATDPGTECGGEISACAQK